jgi:cytochrome b involved in lipid metabolism
MPLCASCACMSRKDYYVNVVDRTHVEVKLAADAWMPAGKSGDLKVVAVDTGAGKVSVTLARYYHCNNQH